MTVTKRQALGKGLSALLPVPDPQTVGPAPDGTPAELPVGALEPNPLQPRTILDPARLSELSASVKESGIVQPILVRRRGDRYQIVAGERRWRAAQAAGLASVPVVIRDIPDNRLLEVALIENIQRAELSPLEEATAFQRMQEELNLTQEEVAQKVGRERSTVANTLRLLRLPAVVKGLLAEGRLDAGHARAILALDRADDQEALAREAARKGLSVREVERRVGALRAPRGKAEPKRLDANSRAAEEQLKAALGVRTEIKRQGKGGYIRVLFQNEAELQRLYELLVRVGRGR